MTLSIRLAGKGDLDDITHLEDAAFDPALYHRTNRRQLAYQIQSPHAEVWLAEQGGSICGMVVMLYRRTSAFGRLYSIAVLPEFQGGEVGKRLFQAAEAACLGKDKRGMILEIRADNQRHYNRYIRLGYTEQFRQPDYYPDGMACIKMKKVFGNEQG